MQIIFGDNVDLVRDRFTVLELDTFQTANSDQPVTAWCVVDSMPLHELGITENLAKLHSDLMAEFKRQRWQFCLACIDQLKGRWNGEVDSFYQDLETRIRSLLQNPPDASWTPVRLKIA